MDRMIAEAKLALEAGKSLDQFTAEQLYKKPRDEPEAGVVEKAKDAYRAAEL